MISPTRRLASAGMVVLAAVGMTGCAGDRSADAERIRAAVQTLPGVDSSNVSYVNDFENGANLDISLDMPHATTDQIRAAVESIDDLEGSHFGDHRRTTAITVADSAEVEYGGYGMRLDATQFSTDVAAVRNVRDHATAATIRWQHFDDYSSLDLWESTNPDEDLRATITALPDISTHVYIRSVAPERHSSWDVTPPLTLEEMNAAVGIRDRLPVLVYQMDMRDGRIGELSVGLDDSAAAASQLAAAVSGVAPTQAHPLTVEWRLAGATPGEVSRFTACSPTTPSTVAPSEHSFASLTEWVARAFPACGP